MTDKIVIDSAEALKRIITNAAVLYQRKRRNKKIIRPFWAIISELTGYGSNYSSYLTRSYGFSPDTGEAEV